MAKFLDFTGLEHFKDKLQTWASTTFRKTTDKVLSTDVTYNSKSLDEAIKSGEFKGDPGAKGDPGTTPNIGANGNWFLGDTDTGKPSRGEKGEKGDPGSDANVQSITTTEIDTLF